MVRVVLLICAAGVFAACAAIPASVVPSVLPTDTPAITLVPYTLAVPELQATLAALDPPTPSATLSSTGAA